VTADEELPDVFKALADPTRRFLLDLLFEHDGLTLTELESKLSMTRFGVMKHLKVLEEAGLVVVQRSGNKKLHYLNPVPLHEITDRWIQPFESYRLHALHEVKLQAEETHMTGTTEKPTFVYVTYIHSTPEKVWEALTSAELTAAYWGHSNVSDWQKGSKWEHVRTDGSGVVDVAGEVIEATPPRRLVITFGGTDQTGQPTVVTFDVEPHRDIVRVTVTHEGLDDPSDYRAVSTGWPAVLSNLKSLLETGQVLPQSPWEMDTELRDQQMSRNG
jgi:uncharacterized protein YndB with AHSA1/START domain/DNA-binding transcriptional ArsR family regulator